ARARIHFRDNLHIRASADGTTFGTWSTGGSPTGIGALVLVGNKVDAYYEHSSTAHVVPGPDGRLLFTGNGLLHTAQLKLVGGSDRRGQALCVPALHGQYYLRVASGDVRDFRNRNEDRKTSVSLHMVGDERPLAQLPQLTLPSTFGFQARNDFTFDKR